jgi:hypothetical protein
MRAIKYWQPAGGSGDIKGEAPGWLLYGKARKADVFEYACHEGNYAMRNILSGARAAEQTN